MYNMHKHNYILFQDGQTSINFQNNLFLYIYEDVDKLCFMFFQAENLMKKIGVTNSAKLTEYELTIASHLVDPLSIQVHCNFDCIHIAQCTSHLVVWNLYCVTM